MQENIQDLILQGRFTNPHSVLGLQNDSHQSQVIRLWRPDCQNCVLEVSGKTVEARLVHPSGLYEYQVSLKIKPTDYRIFHQNGKKAHDPYAFALTFGDLDIHLLERGLHYELHDLLGATTKVHQGIMGTNFALWAPNALSSSLIGDFNQWDGRLNPMRAVGSTGVWEIFIPGLGENEKYKFEILTKDQKHMIKSDPVAHFAELRPKTASVVFDVTRFHWSDTSWLKAREKNRKASCPINIYEVHPDSWSKLNGAFLNSRDLAKSLYTYCKEMGYTHVELMGICEYPFDESWGYQTTGYFASTSRYGSPEDFQFLVNELHENEIGVILDWAPAHFPTDDFSLARFDGTYLYEHIDPRQGYHPHWNTHIFNYGRWEVSNFLIASALFWFEKMHIDGLRVDAVASMIYLDYGRNLGEWVPNHKGGNVNFEAIEFMKHMNSVIHQKYPGILMIAEDSSLFEGVTKDVQANGLGFDLKWNLGWMNDTFRFFALDFSQRPQNLFKLTHILEYAFRERFILVLSHDEVVHEKKSLLTKMPGNEWEKFAGVRLLLSFMMCIPGKKLLFMGSEFGQYSEWNCNEEVHWDLLEKPLHAQLKNMVKELNHLYLKSAALFDGEHRPESFEWVHVDIVNGVIGYLRKGSEQTFLCLHNFCPNLLEKYHFVLKNLSQIHEVFQTDEEKWGGTGNIKSPVCDEQKGEIKLTIPPLSTLIFEVKFH